MVGAFVGVVGGGIVVGNTGRVAKVRLVVTGELRTTIAKLLSCQKQN